MGAYLGDVSVDYRRSGTVIAREVVVDDLTLKGTRQLCGLIPLALLGLGLTSCEPLFSGFTRDTTCTGAGADGETLACEPGLEDTADDVQSTGLNHTTPDRFAAPDSNVDDALESERETVGSLLIERFWVETWGWIGGMGIGRG
jgi:hypothetical protein